VDETTDGEEATDPADDGSVVDETPVSEEATEKTAAEEPAGEETPAAEEDFGGIVEALDEAGAVLVDEEGEAIPLASAEAEDALETISAESSDPYFSYYEGGSVVWVGYTHIGGTCHNIVGSTGGVCHYVEQPIQAALDDTNSTGRYIRIDGSASDYVNDVFTLDGPALFSLRTDANVTVDTINLNTSLSNITYDSNYNYSFFANTINVLGGGTTASIQDGIDIVTDGGTVNVAAGIYEEEINIVAKDLTLQGSTGTVIQSPSVIYAGNTFTTSAPNKAIVFVNDANVTIDRIYLDGLGRGNANYRFIGIGYYNAGGTISNSTIVNITDTPFSGAQHGNAIYAYNNNGVARVVNIADNTIINFQKNGITANGSDLTANISGNTVTGIGKTTITAQNGIQIGFDATGTITDNVVSDIWYTPASWGASGILLYGASGTVIVDNNDVDNAGFGVAVIDSVAELNNNTISGSAWGVPIQSYYVAQTANATLIGNVIENSTVEGIYTDNPDTFLKDNIITGNATGYIYDNYWSLNPEGTSVAEYNYWGCDAGPGYLGCDSVSGSVEYDPWLIDPDSDLVFESSDGTGGYVDNCPTTANPDQLDSDGDGIGDACDPTPFGPKQAGPGPAFGFGPGPLAGLIPVTGAGELVELSCEYANTLELPGGDSIFFDSVLCGYFTGLASELEGTLPAVLPDGSTFVSGLTLNLLLDGELVDGETFTVSFAIPEGMEGSDFAIMAWDADTDSWVEVGGVSVIDGFVTVTVDYSGTFVLVAR